MTQLNTLITHLLGDLTMGDRQKIMTICTIDVHARDVVAKLIQHKVENSQAFVWLSQLRHRYGNKVRAFVRGFLQCFSLWCLLAIESLCVCANLLTLAKYPCKALVL